MSEILCNLKKAGSGSGKTPVLKTVNLGTGTSINIKNHATLGAIYDQLTTDNFYYRCKNTGNSSWSYGAGSTSADDRLGSLCSASFGTFSYNATTGILTCANGSARGVAGQPAAPAQVSSSIAITSTKYCVYIDYE